MSGNNHIYAGICFVLLHAFAAIITAGAIGYSVQANLPFQTAIFVIMWGIFASLVCCVVALFLKYAVDIFDALVKIHSLQKYQAQSDPGKIV